MEIFNSKDHFKEGSFYCLLNGKTYPTIYGLMNALRNKYTAKQFFDLFYKTDICGRCVECGAETKFKNVVEGYKKLCSVCAKDKAKEIRRVAVSNRFKCDDREKKIKASNEKRTKTNSLKSEEEKRMINEKRLQTCKDRYGEDYMSKKTEKQWQRRTEEEKKLLVEKANTTKIKNGTMEYNLYASCNKKIFIEGKDYYCQGYEDSVIRFLIENMALAIKNGKEIPRIISSVNRSGYHRTDIYLEKFNLLIEVKSDFTFSIRTKKIITHQKDAIKQGYIHIVFVIKKLKKDRTLLEKDKMVFREFLNMIISSQAQVFEKVQRLSLEEEYRAIAIGSGSARVPEMVCDIV